ncbi:TetR/AcrR family transcriptional regulator [Nocardioides sp. CFH 31398]|uniref:TetR/AcrR family transcriptional regulator n=1 Tax=Nocardioides sp. CFH 31398 TaxID=2919579 RepID=UPI001F07054B|nr:TetR/AcrR family transcriptional regulator [Nocardioides sp. CFH 31398]MCH1867932.1 TetR/AcrR family transcriptional regulator [Nocardioides sp. CFH 31398]
MADDSRPYRSAVREQRAAETRGRVLEAAARCFVEHGWAGTTMTAIAREAGVSTKTVHDTGTKAFLLLEAFRVRYVGRGGWAAITDDPETAALLEITDPREALAVAVDWLATAHARSADLWFTLRATARFDPQLDAAYAEHLRLKTVTFRETAEWLLRCGVVPAAAVDDEQLDRFASLVAVAMGAETYVQLVHDHGYTDEQYRAWLRRTIPALRP